MTSRNKPAKGFSRAQRIQGAMHRELARLLLLSKDPRFAWVTVTHLELTPDLRLAKVFVSVLEDQQMPLVLPVLNRATGFLRSQLANNMMLRYTPKLLFLEDEVHTRSRRIDALLQGL